MIEEIEEAEESGTAAQAEAAGSGSAGPEPRPGSPELFGPQPRPPTWLEPRSRSRSRGSGNDSDGDDNGWGDTLLVMQADFGDDYIVERVGIAIEVMEEEEGPGQEAAAAAIDVGDSIQAGPPYNDNTRPPGIMMVDPELQRRIRRQVMMGGERPEDETGMAAIIDEDRSPGDGALENTIPYEVVLPLSLPEPESDPRQPGSPEQGPRAAENENDGGDGGRTEEEDGGRELTDVDWERVEAEAETEPEDEPEEAVDPWADADELDGGAARALDALRD